MTPVAEKSRHCAACDRVLIDFSSMSDLELGNYLRRHPGKLCGRFSSRQLDRHLALGGPRRIGGLRAAAAAAGLLLTLPASAQQMQPVPTEQLAPPAGNKAVPAAGETKEQGLSWVTITGLITDENGEPLIGASILVKGTTTGTVADLEGNYELKVSTQADVTLLINYLGFAPIERIIKVADLQDGRVENGKMKMDTARMEVVLVAGYVVYQPSLPRRIFINPVQRFVIRPVRRLVHSIGDWHDGRFARRAARKLRREERLAGQEDNAPVPAAVATEKAAERSVVPETIAPQNLAFRAFPNPFTDYLEVSFRMVDKGPYQLELYSAAGQLLGVWEGVAAAGLQAVRLDQQLAQLPDGLYFLEIRTADTTSVLALQH